jgi:hypothetical protein
MPNASPIQRADNRSIMRLTCLANTRESFMASSVMGEKKITNKRNHQGRGYAQLRRDAYGRCKKTINWFFYQKIYNYAEGKRD